MEGKLKHRNGKTYVRYAYNSHDEPFQIITWWRVLETHGTGYGERPELEDIATWNGEGVWKTRNPSTQRTTGSVSTGTGSTKGERERVAIPPPAVGKREIRWRDGRWEKLMAKGWVPAGEGKTKATIEAEIVGALKER